MSDGVVGERRWAGRVAVVAGLVVCGLVGGWALRTLLTSAPDVLEAPDYTLVEARHGTVEHSLRLNTSAQWSPETVVASLAVGVVTTIGLASGAVARPGTVVFTVDLRPVVVAVGEVPAFRDLGPGSRGADVAQLQRMLAQLGHYRGRADGVFGTAVGSAVRSWQRKLRVTADGTVRRGDVLFVPRLPARLALAENLTVGASLSGGELVVQVLPEAPRFSITLPDQQATIVAPDMSVEIQHDGGTWHAKIAQVSREVSDAATFVAALSSVDGDAICKAECASVPFGDASLLPSVIRVVAPVSGVTVPTAALVTTADGRVAVVRADGTLVPVTVVASAQGMAVVEGLSEGELVRAPGEAP